MNFKGFIFCISMLFFTSKIFAQKDSIIKFDNKTVTLSEVVINNKLNVANFIARIKNDTSFYKAFRNLHILNFSAINDIRMNNKEGIAKATLFSKTKQIRSTNCRKMQIVEEKTTGNFYNSNHEYNYYTPEMYASLFFTKDSICGEDNIVSGKDFNISGKSGIEKHKAQLKKLFFNPGQKINGIPFLSNKTDIYDTNMMSNYDVSIDMDIYNNTNCYIFKQIVKSENKNNVVIDEMTTWFDSNTFEVRARNYHLSYSAGVYDFDVNMEVVLSKVDNFLVPTLLKYNGNWKAIFKPREIAVFTATLYDFK